MATHAEILARYAANAGTDRKMLHSRNANIVVSRDGTTVYSYGTHFPMAKIMPAEDARGWWLVNGDRYSVTTSHHQSQLRDALGGTSLPSMILPFSALGSADVIESSITPVEILPDRYTTVTHRGTLADMPEHMRANPAYWGARALDSERWEWDSQEHHLGEAVFSALVREHHATRDARGNADPYGWTTTERRAWFLSGFDTQEAFGLYFLAELPGPAETVAEAYESLKPAEVKAAEAAGLTVTRQGDVFAVPHPEVSTRGLLGPTMRMALVAGTDSHVATESRGAYSRGNLWHRPRTQWGTPRRPEHRRQTMGDGRTWHLLMRNTVPAGRSWSIAGNVD